MSIFAAAKFISRYVRLARVVDRPGAGHVVRLEHVDLNAAVQTAGVVEQPLERVQALGAESDDRDSHGAGQAAPAS